MPALIQPLPEGPLDILGDIHGELEALLALLHRLGVDPERRTASRPLVFLGDLVDRGPDSVGVIELVRHLVEAGLARCVLGNHELNLLCGEKKEGSGWYWGDPADHAQVDGQKIPFASRMATPSEQAACRDFFRQLPIAMERSDLRVVHAYWEEDSARQLPAEGDAAALKKEWQARLQEELRRSGLAQQAEEERREVGTLHDQHRPPPRHLSALAACSEILQRCNPIKALTSGIEEPVAPGDHFFVNGKWRFLNRARWWKRPVDRATVVGHYWRRRSEPIPGKMDVWDDLPPFAWSGGVFCVDYSVGRRFRERLRGTKQGFVGALGALRWPERVLLFDDRETPVETHGMSLPGRP
jgi:hypothetical protein